MHYLVGYIGDYESKSDWLRECTLTWEKNIGMISKTAGKYLQESCVVVAYVIQSEWIFLKKITWVTGVAFAGVEKMIWGTFLPHLFFIYTKSLSTIVRTLSTVPVKKPGLGFLNPVTTTKEKYPSFQQGNAELIWAVTEGGHSQNPNAFWSLGGKGVTGRKTRITQTTPHSRF